MWVIGMLVCLGLMLGGGHAVMNAGHGSQSHHGAAVQASVAPAATPDEGGTGAAPESASQPQPERRQDH